MSIASDRINEVSGMALAGTPVLILKEGTERTRGKRAQFANIAAAKAIAETIKTTLGPRGMDKMLVDTLGDVTVTNDGAAILKEIDVEHPAAKMIVEVAKTQDDEVGDGTTTAVVLAGELLSKAEELIDNNIHPTVIISGYQKSAERAKEHLSSIAIKVDPDDLETLKKAAMTSMNSKSVADVKDYFADIAVKAVKHVAEERDGKIVVDLDNIQIIKKEGKGLLDTQLVMGMIIDKEVVHPGMPKRIEDAKIALLNTALEVEKTEFDAKIRITNPEQIKMFLDEEERMLREMVEKIKAIGANVVFCQKGIDDMAQHFLAKAGILAVRRVKKSDMEKLARATGGKIVTSVEDLKAEDLGWAKVVYEKRIGEDKMVFVEECKNPRSISILIRGGLERMVDEAERAMNDALNVVADILEEGHIVAGGGAPEIEAAKVLRDYMESVGGREQLAIEAFAEAIEVIPATLAENAGMNPIDILVELRAAHKKPEGKWIGVDVMEGKTANMMDKGVIEPLKVKLQAIKSAVEAASMILRIDDVIAASKLEEKEKEKEKTPPEMGGF